MDNRELQHAITFANQLADASGAIIREAMAAPPAFTPKADNSPVTEIDKKVERELRRLIEATYPSHGILGEEYGGQALDNDYVWVIDPIDGTKPFIAGVPVFGTLIALTFRGSPILGVIDHPVTRERWVGADGIPTTLNGVPVRTRPCPDLAGAIISTSNPDLYGADGRPAFERLRAAAHWCLYGASCYAYGRLASGAIDVSIDEGFSPHDYCALVPVIRGAGGVVTDWNGDALTIRSGRRVLAAGSAELHAKALQLVRQR